MFRKVPSRYLGIRTERSQTHWALAWPTPALLEPPHLDWRSLANWLPFRPDPSLRYSPRSVFGYIRLLPSPSSGRRRINGVLKHCCSASVQRARGCTCDGHPLFLPTQPRQMSLQSPLHNIDDPRVADGMRSTEVSLWPPRYTWPKSKEYRNVVLRCPHEARFTLSYVQCWKVSGRLS